MIIELLIFSLWLILTILVTGVILTIVMRHYDAETAARWDNRVMAFIAATIIVAGTSHLLAFIAGHLSSRL